MCAYERPDAGRVAVHWKPSSDFGDPTHLYTHGSGKMVQDVDGEID